MRPRPLAASASSGNAAFGDGRRDADPLGIARRAAARGKTRPSAAAEARHPRARRTAIGPRRYLPRRNQTRREGQAMGRLRRVLDLRQPECAAKRHGRRRSAGFLCATHVRPRQLHAGRRDRDRGDARRLRAALGELWRHAPRREARRVVGAIAIPTRACTRTPASRTAAGTGADVFGLSLGDGPQSYWKRPHLQLRLHARDRGRRLEGFRGNRQHDRRLLSPLYGRAGGRASALGPDRGLRVEEKWRARAGARDRRVADQRQTERGVRGGL